MAFSIGGNKSDSKGTMQQEIFEPNAYSDMYNWAQNLFRGMMPQVQHGFSLYPDIEKYQRHAFNLGNTGALDLMRGGSYGNVGGIRSGLEQSLMESMNNPSSMGLMYEDIIGGPGNTYVDPLIDSMRTAGDERRRTMMSGNALNAAAMGQGGSNRHAMQNAMTNRMIDQDLNLAENALRERNYDRDMNWKMNIARQADLGRGQAQDRAMDMLAGRDRNIMASMGFTPTMQNLGMGVMAPFMQALMVPWQMMGSYSNVLGDPTVLTQSQQKGDSGGFGIGF